MNDDGTMKRTPLFDLYRRYGARTVPFGGWEMPVQFSGIIDEHQAVRTRAGIFDVSHMGEIWIEGNDAQAAVQHLTINDIKILYSGRVQYSAMANSEGGLVDDITVYCFSPNRYMLCVNAANIDKDFRWIRAQIERFPAARAIDRSRETALLALQGPESQKILKRLTYSDLEALKYYNFITAKMAGIETIVSRTGYTGEDGFELYVTAEKGPDVWEEIMAVGEPVGLKPCGLGARDTLRLEMGYLLYGQDMDDTTGPLQAGLGWITKLDKGEFVGREAIVRQKAEGDSEVLAAFVCEERGIPRHDYALLEGEKVIGKVTSGTMSPSLKLGIGMGYVRKEAAVPGTGIAVRIRNKAVKAVVVKPPFYRSGSARKK